MSAAPGPFAPSSREPFQRVLAWRANDLRVRAAQAVLLAVLTFIAARDAWVVAWLAFTLVSGFVDSRLSRRLLTHMDNRGLFIATCISQAVSAGSFAGVGLMLLASTSQIRMAEAALLMCAVCLNISVMTRGSKVAAVVLVGPASAVLVASPFVANLFGHGIPVGDVVLLSLSGVAYTVFIVRLAATLSSEGAALRQALEACGAANRAKSDFLAVMSHEIRTPLNGVLGMAQAMEREPLAPAQKERLMVIRDSGASLMDLLNDILDLSKIEAGKLELETATFDLAGVVQSAHAAFLGVAGRKGLAFELDVDEAVRGLYSGDAGRIRQIVCNLISNAVKFTEAGKVAVRLQATNHGAVLTVSDTGVGIPADRIGKLFNKFTQADSSTTRQFGGSGLGLAISLELARAMGGDVTVASVAGQGSTFTLTMPLARATLAESVEIAVDVAAAHPEGAMRILAAEDNPTNQLVLRTLLTQVGLAPVIVDNGALAVAAWEASEWDLILMDIQMPVMDGPTAAAYIRQRERELGRAATPIIALTANAMAHQAASYRAIGMNGVVAKPVDIAELLMTIAQVAGESEEADFAA